MKLANMAVSVGVLSSIFYRWSSSLRLKLPKAWKLVVPSQKAFPSAGIQKVAGIIPHDEGSAFASYLYLFSSVLPTFHHKFEP